MKKVMIAVAAVLCLVLASCSGNCKCKTIIAGEVVSTATITESTLQKAGVTCEQYNEILQLSMGLGEEAKEYSIQCK